MHRDREKYLSYQREYYTKNREIKRPGKRKNWLKTQYGLSLEDYNQILIDQDFSCALCKKHMSNFNRPLHVDHCHQTDVIRGLLCHKCNTALGSLGDTKESIENVLKYLTVNQGA